MNSLCSELRWLLRAPKDFCDSLKALGNFPDPVGGELQALAPHGLNLNQLTKLAPPTKPVSNGFTLLAEAPVS